MYRATSWSAKMALSSVTACSRPTIWLPAKPMTGSHSAGRTHRIVVDVPAVYEARYSAVAAVTASAGSNTAFAF